MDEELKYYKLSGGNIEPGGATIVVACKPDEEERLREMYRDYELTETERPADAHIVTAEPTIQRPRPFVMPEYGEYLSMYEPMLNIRHAVYDGPNCARCQNSYKASEWCSRHYRSTKPCYRFKLER